MKSSLVLFFGLFFGSIGLSSAQETEENTLYKLGRINWGLHGFELSYEAPVSKSLVWENSLGAGMGASANNGAVEFLLDFAQPVPFVKSQLKLIYNRNKRIRKERTVAMNAGNYVGLQSKYSFGKGSDRRLNETLLTELHWGFQRPLGKKFTLNTHVGLGYLRDFDRNGGGASLTLGVRFGYVILKK